MRDIIFRGKRTDNGEWEYGDLWCNPYGKRAVCIVSPINDQGTTGGNEVLPETVGQYTGLTDKNGKKIFEGDILGGYLDDNYPENLTVMEVVWCKCWWGTKEIGCDPDPLEWEDGEILEVVGNIHDNPEMIEREFK